jgi:hypothetical protein
MKTMSKIETSAAIRPVTANEVEGAELRRLSTAELDDVAGGFVEVLAYVAASNYAYYRYAKWAGKI